MTSQANQPGGQVNEPIPVGTRLENYRIVRLLASGGFSFVYLAHDENETPVAIKEYLPSTLALRANGESYPRIPEQELATFRVGMKSFFEEGRALAGLSHPNIVRVLNFFRANETVYLVMRYERGRTLHDHIGRRRGALKESWIRATFAQLLNGLREVHSNKLLHLDIKPSNVYLRTDGTPVLLGRSEEHTSELQSRSDLVCRLLLEKKKPTAESQTPSRHTTSPCRSRIPALRTPK